MSDTEHPYYGSDWDDVRGNIIESDGNQCVVCLSDNDLHVHHIEPLQSFESPEEANKEDNLATLCQRCHSRIEVIQDPHKRRGVDNFLAELSAEGVDVSESFLQYLCDDELTKSPPDSEICPNEGCFYAVNPDEYHTCASCNGRISEPNFRSYQGAASHDPDNPFNSQEKHEVTCECGFNPDSDDDLVRHLVNKHSASRLEARKEILETKNDDE